MPDPSPFGIELESFGGLELPSVKSWSIESSYSNPFDTFTVTFNTYDVDRLADPRIADELLWEKVQISIDGRPYMVGRFEDSDVGHNGSEIIMRGCDYRFEMAQAVADPEVKIKEGMTLESVIKQVAGCCGIANVQSDGDARLRDIRTGATVTTPKPYNFKATPLKEYAPNDGEFILAYIRRIAARHRLTVQPSIRRDTVVLSQPDYTSSALWSFIRYRDTGNSLANVKTSRCRRNMRNVPTYLQYDGQSQAAKSGPKPTAAEVKFRRALGLPPPKSAAPPKPNPVVTMEIDWPSEHIPRERAVTERLRPTTGVKLDDGVYRPFFREDPDSKDAEQLSAASLRGMADRMKDMFSWEANVKGHSQNNNTFANDTVADVSDEICGVEQRLWIESVSLSGGGSGSTASIKARLPGTYPF